MEKALMLRLQSLKLDGVTHLRKHKDPGFKYIQPILSIPVPKSTGDKDEYLYSIYLFMIKVMGGCELIGQISQCDMDMMMDMLHNRYDQDKRIKWIEELNNSKHVDFIVHTLDPTKTTLNTVCLWIARNVNPIYRNVSDVYTFAGKIVSILALVASVMEGSVHVPKVVDASCQEVDAYAL